MILKQGDLHAWNQREEYEGKTWKYLCPDFNNKPKKIIKYKKSIFITRQ